MKLSEKTVLAMFFLAAVGICAGAFFEVHMTGTVKDQLAEILINSDPSENFMLSLKNSARVLFPILIAGFTAPYIYVTIPLIPAYIFIRSIALGFTAAMTLEAAGLAGMSTIALRLMPQNLVLLPALAVLAAAACQAGCASFACTFFPRSQAARRNKKALQFNARPYFLIYACGTAAAIFSCFLPGLSL